MGMPASHLATMHLLKENEALIADLYTAYAAHLSAHHDFWSQLAAEEQMHVKWVTALTAEMAGGRLSFRDGMCKPEAFRTFRDYLQRLLADAQAHPPDAWQALNICFDVEQTVVEQNFSKLFEGYTEQAKRILDTLDASTRRHLESVKDTLQMERLRRKPSPR